MTSSRRNLTILLAHVLAQRLEPLRGVDELHLPPPVLRLSVQEHPDVSRDVGVIEHVQRESDDYSSQLFSMIQRRMLLSPCFTD